MTTRIILTIAAAAGFLFQEVRPEMPALFDTPPTAAVPPVRQALPNLWDTEPGPVIRQALPDLWEMADRPGRDNRKDADPPKRERAKTVVYYWTDEKNCPPCKRWSADRKDRVTSDGVLEGLDQRFEFVDGSKKFPNRKVPGSRPYFLWAVTADDWRYLAEYRGPDALTKTIENSFKPRMAAKPKTSLMRWPTTRFTIQTVNRQGRVISERPGTAAELAQHLVDAHGYRQADVRGMNRAQLDREHTQAHNLALRDGEDPDEDIVQVATAGD